VVAEVPSVTSAERSVTSLANALQTGSTVETSVAVATVVVVEQVVVSRLATLAVVTVSSLAPNTTNKPLLMFVLKATCLVTAPRVRSATIAVRSATCPVTAPVNRTVSATSGFFFRRIDYQRSC
jgi:hypothetical protein